MGSSNERLRWAVDFARRDLALCRQGDWLNLRDELAAFFGMRVGDTLDLPLLVTPTGSPHVKDYPEEAFRDLQLKVRELLNGAAVSHAGAIAAQSAGLSTYSVSTVPLLDGQRWAAIAGHDGRVRLMVKTSVRDGLLITLNFLLLLGGAGNVRRCPECGQILWRVKRQLYCSRKCSTRVNMRAYLDRKRRHGAAEPRVKAKRAVSASRKEGRS